jgi:glucose-6-phosphate-specific signal transduction histidine kinase
VISGRHRRRGASSPFRHIRFGRFAGVAGALIAAPLCLYLKDLPYLQWTSVVSLGANFVSAGFLWRGRRDIAFALLLPFMIVIALIAIFWTRDFSVFRGLRL